MKFTFTFRVFSRHLYPKRQFILSPLSIGLFVWLSWRPVRRPVQQQHGVLSIHESFRKLNRRFTILMTVVIVEDELLNFIVIKMRTLSQDDIVAVVTSSFSSERIETSKAVLAELFPHNKRWISFRGQKKDINNVKMCMQVLNECGEEVPRFVSHFLDELPRLI